MATSPEERARNLAEWQPWIDRLHAARAQAREMGGTERLEKHHGAGKLDVRQRVAALFDPGTFNELGTLVGNKSELPADGFVCGFGLVNGRPVAVGAEDFTIKAGSVGTGGAYKRHRIAELAGQEGVPMVWMKEGAGARMGARTSTPARTRARSRWCAWCSACRPATARSPRRWPTSS